MHTLTTTQRAFWFTFAIIAYHTRLREWASSWPMYTKGGIQS